MVSIHLCIESIRWCILRSMSRPSPRVRPTRDETRHRIFEAAAQVIEEVGVGAATVDQIVREAGFTRGAFYSNFENKDDLLISMLQHHLAGSATRNMARLEATNEAASFIGALENDDRFEGDPLHRSPLLQVELTLHVARRAELRPLLADRLRQMRSLVGQIAETALDAAGVSHDLNREDLGFVLVALEDGLRLHRLLDPQSTPEDAFTTVLQQLLGLASSGGLSQS